MKETFLFSDVLVKSSKLSGTSIGLQAIKNRRQNKTLSSYPDLCVGQCVPFYFCSRSVMLYMFYKNNHSDINYSEGQSPIIHLQADLYDTINWANENKQRWVFTDSNAGSYYFNDFNTITELNRINWGAVNENNWVNCRDQKQAEFLIEEKFPWHLVEIIGGFSGKEYKIISDILTITQHKPNITISKNWYY